MKRRQVLIDLPSLAERDAWARARANPAEAVRKLKARHANRMRNLRDPKWGDHLRPFPKWKPGMTTEEYIRLYTPSNVQRTVQYVHRRHVPAPWWHEDFLLGAGGPTLAEQNEMEAAK